MNPALNLPKMGLLCILLADARKTFFQGAYSLTYIPVVFEKKKGKSIYGLFKIYLLNSYKMRIGRTLYERDT